VCGGVCDLCSRARGQHAPSGVPVGLVAPADCFSAAGIALQHMSITRIITFHLINFILLCFELESYITLYVHLTNIEGNSILHNKLQHMSKI
jgi:hypothetical protein